MHFKPYYAVSWPLRRPVLACAGKQSPAASVATASHRLLSSPVSAITALELNQKAG